MCKGTKSRVFPWDGTGLHGNRAGDIFSCYGRAWRYDDRQRLRHILSPEALRRGLESDIIVMKRMPPKHPVTRIVRQGDIGKQTNTLPVGICINRFQRRGRIYPIRRPDRTEQEEKLKQWNDAVNENREHWYPSYWEAYQQAQGCRRTTPKTPT